MKLIGIGLLLLASLEAFAVMLDVFQGMTLQRAIVNSLTFAEVGEWIIILLFLFIIFLEASESFRKKRKRT
ncbi:hypothetical protein EI976_19410 [Bacillus licheniformis]|uniref:hypothetical protein n=1 Tax=Bacillus TaxID=1386 RepID=UPI0002F30716|nr:MULTISPECIES: hypothetical protein [Bacillus subtilis group]KAA0814184.1 hypothetical protein EI978_13860 [Bacillus licheniformis]KAA0819861.1 hypothetical protein EI976_19410 [Bacillus licheniformis]KAA0823015.1 hypothetical protein EI973_17070 [Bacillus licheniformis]MBU8783974.1 hypothetical protein [Bacillus licheniformis]MEC5252085.1 hypothetical protein [Bacillus licheniformis]